MALLSGCATIKRFDYYDHDNDGKWSPHTWEGCRDRGMGSYDDPNCKMYGW
jgi:hypothetical protein